MLTFENICLSSKRPVLNNSSMSAPAQNPYQRWLAKIKGEPVADNSNHNKNLDVQYSTDERTLIADANGTLLSGQLTVLTGQSGSGKSVLLRVLAGLVPMNAGDICYKNSSIRSILPTQWRAQVALLAQHPQLLEGSVLDNLKLPYTLQAHQESRFDSDWHLAQLASLQRPAEFLQQSAHYLSGGERQLVNTLRLLQLNPQVLLLDEPTAALDADTSTQLIKLLMSWLTAEPQRAMLWVTHDVQDIMGVSDKHWDMQAGTLTDIT